VSAFSDAVAAVQPVFAGAANAAYITHADRLDEAEHVEPIVARAVYGELDPTGHHAVGRVTRFSPPGLGVYLSGKGRYTPGDERSAASIADTTRSVMALGWLFMCAPEAPVADRSARDIWNFWAGVSLRDPLDKVVEKGLARLIHRNGARMLATKLKDAGLKPRLGGGQVSQIGYRSSSTAATCGWCRRSRSTSRRSAARSVSAATRESVTPTAAGTGTPIPCASFGSDGGDTLARKARSTGRPHRRPACRSSACDLGGADGR